MTGHVRTPAALFATTWARISLAAGALLASGCEQWEPLRWVDCEEEPESEFCVTMDTSSDATPGFDEEPPGDSVADDDDDDDDTPPGTLLTFADDFTDCSPDWQLSSPWQCGVPTSGPDGAHVGTQILATNLSGNYPNNLRWEAATATSPAFTVPAGGATLSFRAWWDVESPGLSSDHDGWHVRVLLPSGNATVLSTSRSYNVRVGGYSGWAGPSTSWGQITADLSTWARQEIRLQFGMFSDASVNRAGAYIDDIRVE